MSDHFRSSFSLANKTPHALSSSKSINIDYDSYKFWRRFYYSKFAFLYTENIKLN